MLLCEQLRSVHLKSIPIFGPYQNLQTPPSTKNITTSQFVLRSRTSNVFFGKQLISSKTIKFFKLIPTIPVGCYHSWFKVIICFWLRIKPVKMAIFGIMPPFPICISFIWHASELIILNGFSCHRYFSHCHSFLPFYSEYRIIPSVQQIVKKCLLLPSNTSLTH